MKQSLLIRAVTTAGLLLLAAASVSAASSIRLSFRDTTIASGRPVSYPVYVDSSLTGFAVTAYQLQFTYNTTLFSYTGSSLTGALTDSTWVSTVSVDSIHGVTGTVTIAGAGVDTLLGTGKLITLNFVSHLFAGGYNQYGYFTFSSATLNQGSPTTFFRNGTIILTPGPSIVVSPNTALLTKGDTQQFTVSGGKAPYAWSTTAPSLATIDSTGKLTAVAAGFVKVVCTDSSGYVDTTGTIEIRAFRMFLRDTSQYQGQLLNLPVYCTDLTGLGVTSGQLTITFDVNRWTPDSVMETGTVLASYGQTSFSVGSGTMSISFAGVSPLSGSGVLLYVRMKASKVNYGTSGVAVQSGVFNQTLAANVGSANLTVTPLAVLNVTPTGTLTLVVGDSLQFSASGGTAPYQWAVSDTGLAAISATGWLKAKKGGSVTVLAVDALGGSGSSGVVSLFDFRLTIPDTALPPSQFLYVPVNVVGGTSGIYSFQMNFTYPTNYYVQLVDIDVTGSLAASFSIAGSFKSGTATIAAASVNPVLGNGLLFRLKFAVPDSTPAGSTTTIGVSNVVFNQGSPLAFVHNGSLQVTNRAIFKVSPLSATLAATVGNKDSTILTVYNKGNITLTSSNSVVGSSAFTLSPVSISVLAGDSAKVKVYFQPSVAGADSANVQFSTNDPYNPLVAVKVKGNTSGSTGVGIRGSATPKEYSLDQNYPNPFNPSTIIRYGLVSKSIVRLEVFNVLGQKVDDLVNAEQAEGYHAVTWHALVPSGVYFYRIEATSLDNPGQHFSLIRKMVFMK